MTRRGRSSTTRRPTAWAYCAVCGRVIACRVHANGRDRSIRRHKATSGQPTQDPAWCTGHLRKDHRARELGPDPPMEWRMTTTPCPLGCGWLVPDVDEHMADHHPDATGWADPRSNPLADVQAALEQSRDRGVMTTFDSRAAAAFARIRLDIELGL